MIPRIALLACLLFVVWAVRRDIKLRLGVSRAVWVPMLWVFILGSRPLSTWLGGGIPDSPQYSLEGSPIDRFGFLFLIAAGFWIITRRQVNWRQVVSRNRPVFFFYLFFLFSVLWASSPFASFKRLVKDFGNVIILLVILTEANPTEAFKAVFVRCAYALISFSTLFLRYFPDLGRHYNIHSGEMEATGVTFQKNSLGAMVLVCGTVVFWDLLTRYRSLRIREGRVDILMLVGVLFMSGYLLHVSDSKTATVCLVLSGAILLAIRMPILRRNAQRLVAYTLTAAMGVVVLDNLFGIKELLVSGLGRDMTFTGRTEVWHALLALKTNPVIGTGFCDIWSNLEYRNRLPDWVAYAAHNGYLEMYLDGGFIGVGLLALMLTSMGWKINHHLKLGNDYAIVQFAVFAAMLVYNFSESCYGRLGLNWFIFLLAATDYTHWGPQNEEVQQPMADQLNAKPGRSS